MQTIEKSEIKGLLVETILPCYNNMALCSLKQNNWQMVIKFCDQVIGQDADNVKARYRRAMALK